MCIRDSYTAKLQADQLVAGINAHVDYTESILKFSDATIEASKRELFPVLCMGCLLYTSRRIFGFAAQAADHPRGNFIAEGLSYLRYAKRKLPSGCSDVYKRQDINGTKDLTRFGRPKLGFLVTSGNIDSMVSHYTCLLYTSRCV